MHGGKCVTSDHDDHAADRGAQRRRSIAELNAELCGLLGITDLSDVVAVTLVLAPSDAPRVTVKRLLRRGAVLRPCTRRFRLEPEGPGAPERPPP